MTLTNRPASDSEPGPHDSSVGPVADPAGGTESEPDSEPGREPDTEPGREPDSEPGSAARSESTADPEAPPPPGIAAEVSATLSGLTDRPVEEHPEVYEAVHRRLGDTLSAIDDL